jgi:hypothetical protein
VKKALFLLLIVFFVFFIVNRQRLYLRDPFGSVVRDRVKEKGAQVYINYSSDVLIENDNAPRYVLVVQHGEHAGTPQELRCMHWMVCLADENVVTLVAPMLVNVNQMSGKIVEFHDMTGQDVKVMLR